MEEKAKKLLSKHGCKFIKMLTECSVMWENKIGIVREDDIAVLNLMTAEAWNFWSVN